MNPWVFRFKFVYVLSTQALILELKGKIILAETDIFLNRASVRCLVLLVIALLCTVIDIFDRLMKLVRMARREYNPISPNKLSKM